MENILKKSGNIGCNKEWIYTESPTGNKLFLAKRDKITSIMFECADTLTVTIDGEPHFVSYTLSGKISKDSPHRNSVSPELAEFFDECDGMHCDNLIPRYKQKAHAILRELVRKEMNSLKEFIINN